PLVMPKTRTRFLPAAGGAPPRPPWGAGAGGVWAESASAVSASRVRDRFIGHLREASRLPQRGAAGWLQRRERGDQHVHASGVVCEGRPPGRRQTGRGQQ